MFRLDDTVWDEFVEILDRPARPIPELARLLSSASVFDDQLVSNDQRTGASPEFDD
ncbi:MAG TPA: DUF1778 domain-containing protein [Solirubrobacteraceae bacterium]|nr:DUF1778 domain-containing protein [Solirubrobacteraceae bacterium]